MRRAQPGIHPLRLGPTARRDRPGAWGAHLLLTFGAEFAGVITRPEGSGTLVAAALELGKLAIAAELGGGGGVTPATLAAARVGCRQVLDHLGILPSSEARRTSRLLAVENRHFLRSPERGLFESVFTLGQTVAAGDLAVGCTTHQA